MSAVDSLLRLQSVVTLRWALQAGTGHGHARAAGTAQKAAQVCG